MEVEGRIPAAEEAWHFRWFQLLVAFPLAEARKKMAGEACLFADIAPDTGFGTARVIAPRTVSDILRAPALHIAFETRATSCAFRPIGNPLG